MNYKPDIIEVIAARVELRKAGLEWRGLCPFHADRHPSLRVNQEKGFWFCDPCGQGGDVFQFIQKFYQVDFKEASHILNAPDYRPRPRPHQVEAQAISAWARDTSRKVCDALREIGDEIYMCSDARKQPYADKKLLVESEASLIRQWAILEDLDDDLNDPTLVLELWARRNDIESVVDSAIEAVE